MDEQRYSRRDFMRLAGLGGVVFASGLGGCTTLGQPGAPSDFHFVQISDVHHGYANSKVNPEAANTLARTVAAVNALEQKPDFVVFTGDLTQTTDDPKLRRRRLAEFRDVAARLNVPTVHYLQGEHDASLDRAEAFRELFGERLHYAFDHKGVHFIVLDNTSDPAPVLGAGQIAWLSAHLRTRRQDEPIVVLTHRPLFPLYPQWDWATRDGQAALDLLAPFRNVTVFYGHIHHEHHGRTGSIEHHAATAVMFPLSPVGTAEQKTQLPWDPANPFKGLGFRSVWPSASGQAPRMREWPVARG